MPRNFYYGKQADIVAGSANFAGLISSGFATYGLTTAQAENFGTLDTALQSAYTAGTDPSTKTRVTVQGKRNAINAMRADAILLAKIVYATSTVTDEQLVALGLLPRASHKPIPVTDTAPVVEVDKVIGRLVTVRVHGAPPDSSRGKPTGARSANIYSFVGPAAPTDPRDFHFEGTATRTITKIQFPNTVASGATVWLSSCWVSNRGDTGPASDPISFTMQGGNVLPEAM